MDGIRGEVSNKIRSAIKAKLMELGAYVDDELPDYIMVMVANKRSRQQMEDDLQLFLGDSTSTFTSWLHTVLSKLQQVTVNSAELKKTADKKRPSPEDEKKEKRKKIKKEKEKEKPDKQQKSPEKNKIKERTPEDITNVPNETSLKSRPVKKEPSDLTPDEDPHLNKSQTPSGVKVLPSNSIGAKDKKAPEEEEDDDFINLKADVETDMWGESEETSTAAAKISSINKSQPPLTGSVDIAPPKPTVPEIESEQLKSARITPGKTSSSTPITVPLTGNASTSSSLAKNTVPDPKPSPRIIKISETIRQEQETLKPASKVVKDPQNEEERSPPSPIIFSKNKSTEIEDDLEIFGRHIAQELRQMPQRQQKLAKLKIQQALAKRVFQSHIVSQRNVQNKGDRSRRRSSSTTDNQPRKSDQRTNRKHEHQDLRETIRKERQKEREHGRDREHEQRRSRDQNSSRKPQSGVASVVRPTLARNGSDPPLLSVVRVKPRPQVPAKMQANRSLILKAVAEAQKSVSKVAIRSEVTNPKTTPKLNTRSVKDRLQMQKKSPPKRGSSALKHGLPSRETLRKMSFTVPGKKVAPSKESLVAEFGDGSDEGSIILDPSVNILIQVPTSPAVEESQDAADPVQVEKVRRWIEDVEEATKSEVISSEPDLSTNAVLEMDTFPGSETASNHVSYEDPDDIDDDLELDNTSLKTSDVHSGIVSDSHPQRKPTGTQFVVTLDGFDPMLLRSFALESGRQVGSSTKDQMTVLPDDENADDTGEEESLLQEELIKEQQLRQELLRQQAAARRQKAVSQPSVSVSSLTAPLNPSVKRPASPNGSLEARPSKVISTLGKVPNSERCKFWPSCKNGDKCEFHHPSVSCKLFPNCKFAERCLYIHPTCRFNTTCSRAECSYTHTGPRPTLSSPPAGVSHLGSQTIKQACKFFPNCNNLSCPYIHPTVRTPGTRSGLRIRSNISQDVLDLTRPGPYPSYFYINLNIL